MSKLIEALWLSKSSQYVRILFAINVGVAVEWRTLEITRKEQMEGKVRRARSKQQLKQREHQFLSHAYLRLRNDGGLDWKTIQNCDMLDWKHSIYKTLVWYLALSRWWWITLGNKRSDLIAKLLRSANLDWNVSTECHSGNKWVRQLLGRLVCLLFRRLFRVLSLLVTGRSLARILLVLRFGRGYTIRYQGSSWLIGRGTMHCRRRWQDGGRIIRVLRFEKHCEVELNCWEELKLSGKILSNSALLYTAREQAYDRVNPALGQGSQRTYDRAQILPWVRVEGSQLLLLIHACGIYKSAEKWRRPDNDSERDRLEPQTRRRGNFCLRWTFRHPHKSLHQYPSNSRPLPIFLIRLHLTVIPVSLDTRIRT